MTLTEKPLASLRKRRTRTLIQLGGLIEKSGLMEKLEIEVGDDLQEGVQSLKAATLLGALGDLVGYLTLSESDAQKSLWAQKGKEIFGQKGDE